LKQYHYFVSYDIFDSEQNLVGKGNSGCVATKKIEDMQEIKTMEKKLEELSKVKGNTVVINNYRLLRVEA
jgi:hypothetical protein